MAYWRRPRQVWTRSCASAPICSGSVGSAGRLRRRRFWHQAQYQRFCERAYALWERARAVREARRTSTGFGRAPLRRADTVARRAQRDSSLVSVEQRSRQRLSMSSGGSRRRKRPLRPSRITRLRLRLAVPHRFESLAVTIPPRWQLANTHGQRSLSGSTEWKKKEQASSC